MRILNIILLLLLLVACDSKQAKVTPTVSTSSTNTPVVPSSITAVMPTPTPLPNDSKQAKVTPTVSTSSTNTPVVPSSITAVMPTPMPLPNFLSYVSPEPGSIYTLAEFNQFMQEKSDVYPFSEIFFWIGTKEMLTLLEEEDDFSNVRQFLHRIDVTINGQLTELESSYISDSYPLIYTDPVTKATKNSVPGGVPFALFYPLDIKVGLHTVEIEVNKTSGDVVKYSWSFLIIE